MADTASAAVFDKLNQSSPVQQPLTADDFFGSGNGQQGSESLPSADEFFTPKESTFHSVVRTLSTALSPFPNADVPAPSDSFTDYLFNKTPAGRVLHAFGQSAANAWGSEPLGMSQDTQDSLKRAGVFNDYKAGHASTLKYFNETFLRPAAVALDAANRTMQAGLGGAQGAIVQGATEAGQPKLGEDVAGYLGTGTPELLSLPHPSPNLTQARSLGVIGEGESGFFGTKAPEPVSDAARADAVKQVVADQKTKEPAPGTAPEPQSGTIAPTEVPEPSAAPQAPDIHAAARQIDPVTFQNYDALTARQDTYRRWIDELSDKRTTDAYANAPHTDEIHDLVAKMDDATPRLQKKYQARIDALAPEQDAYINDVLGKDSPDMARVREQLQNTDYAMRDLAPNVAKAYRQAQEAHPELADTVEPQTAPTQPESSAASPWPEAAAAEGEGVPEQPKAVPAEGAVNPDTPKPEAPVSAPSELQSKITSDASKKLVNAGRPKEEADAAAQLVAAHYQARAERFDGAKGNAYELYAKEGPNIREGGARAKAKELAQGKTLNQAEAPSTKAFKTWFGDSKAVDEDGKPLRLYHGTNSDFENFSEESRGKQTRDIDASRGFFFTDKPEIAGEYAELGHGPGNIVPVYLSLKNPMIEDAQGSPYIRDYFTDVLDQAKESGHDGVIFKNVEDGVHKNQLATTYAVFDPKQIKSVHNSGSFNPEDARILEQSKRGSITLTGARNTIKLFKDADASTFIHETGHQWLEELMHDAADKDAPEELKADAKTVRDYIGAEEGQAIPTRSHEKFARGFERYMMEGVAPSKELAGVFAKFKDWLTKIYQTVAKLRSPISDDIRGVFDRLLSSNPGRTVIAAERDNMAKMADLHEREAVETPPEQADAKADQIEADIDASVKKLAPEVHDELPHKQTGAVARENPLPNGSSNAPEPDTGPAGGTEGRGDIATSRDEITAESTASSEPGSANGRRGREPTAAPDDANQRFADPESDLVDKAGNIRLDNLGTPEDVNAVIRETSANNDDFMGARRAELSDGEVMDLADAIGMPGKMLDRRKIGQAFNAEQIIAARKLLIESATNVRDIMAKAANGTDADLLAYYEAKTQHRMIQEQVAGITAEAGRALRAFRKLEGGEDANALGSFLDTTDARTLNQLKQEAQLGQTLQTPQKVSKFINDRESAWAKTRGMVLEYYVNALISGPITHARYSAGNALNALWRPLVEIPMASAIGKARELVGLTKDGDRVYLGESGAQLYAITKGSRDGWNAAYEAFKSGVTPSLPGESAESAFGVTNEIPGKIGRAINIPSRSVAAIHTFFKALRYEQNKQGLAYRTAMKEGLDGQEFANRVAELTQSPTPDMMDEAGNFDPSKVSPEYAANIEDATKDALKELYMAPTEYGSGMSKLNSFINDNLLAKIIVPFMKIGGQITHNAFIERTPLGIVNKGFRANVISNTAATDLQLGKVASGVALMGITVGLAAEEMATGDGPEDPKQRAAWLLTHRPNTVTIGDISVPYQGLGSLGMLMRFSANMYQAGQGPEDSKALAVLQGLTKSVLDENFMRGVKDALDAVYHPEEYGPNYLRQFALNWLPWSVGMGQVARTVDPYQRVSNTLEDAAMAKVPWVSEYLPEKSDMFGEPIPSSGNIQSYENDPVVNAMDSLQTGIGKLNRKIRGVQLSDEEYDDYSRVAGRMTKLQLNQIVAMPGFDQLPSYERLSMISHAVSSSRETARTMVLMQNPDLIQRAQELKTAGLKH